MIEVKNLVKKYGNHLAVDHLDFTVEKGQIYGFLGPNGAGKSTTMNIITGYISATEGQVLINGHDIFEEPENAKKAIGYLPEIPPLYMDMTSKEYLQFAAELKKIPKDQRKRMINEVMELTKIDSVKDRLIKNLSKGYRQRVGLAQAILGYPEIIILDEPTVGLDPKQIIEIRDLIKELSKKHTVILSSHILSEVSALCDHVLIISNGKLVASDTPEHLGELMAGSNTVVLTVKGSTEKIKSVLNSINEIRDYQITKSMESGSKDIKIQMKSQTDIREKLFFTFAEQRCPILMMDSTKISLEDVFLELTSKEQINEEIPENLQEEVEVKVEEEEQNESNL
ncbi:ABC transporter ATP-binding protein [Anaerosacchariphilus polymeriproducens]|uniref:ABC transporter ATP-binding protein n=1 Tax=Anaerosacchariphilus polymeriproducens TaxID=1812858 RepID=A0A371AW46_9FIRM|nr:ABC transporter ATP-binding protein [Anaerosacchariphilus polymeriproducens]RDU23761.1 ABC transporter ATP-binding protein [Anaerosacchariphilus polymeriproducens]